jgi:hypothetical protein
MAIFLRALSLEQQTLPVAAISIGTPNSAPRLQIAVRGPISR